jgi:hypothetical protein
MSDKFRRLTENPGAVVNTDSTGLKAYKLAKKNAVQQKEEINSLKQEVADLKQLLTNLIEKLDR